MLGDTVQIPVVYDGEAIAVSICDLCGQLMGELTECFSSIHYGPTGSPQFVGSPILSTTMAFRYRTLLEETSS